MSNQSDGKLIATAMGAAAAGATLAVMAMKMIDSKNEKSFYSNNNNNGGGGHNNNNNNNNSMLDKSNGLSSGTSNTNLLAYHADENRPIRPTVIMNDPSDLVGDHHLDSSFNVASAGASQYVDIDAEYSSICNNIGVPGVGISRDSSGGGGGPNNSSMRRDSSEAMLFPHNHEEKMRRRIATRYTIEEENNLGRDSVTVRVPATSANVGPGCKCEINIYVLWIIPENPNIRYLIPYHIIIIPIFISFFIGNVRSTSSSFSTLSSFYL